MTVTRRGLLGLMLLPSLAACGGGDDLWDEFRPRAATPADLQNHAFTFTGFRYGAVFHASWTSTSATLSFDAASGVTAPVTLPFLLATGAAGSMGTATLDGDQLSLRVTQPAATHPFAVGELLTFTVTADVDDGRIRLRNRVSGEEQACAPV